MVRVCTCPSALLHTFAPHYHTTLPPPHHHHAHTTPHHAHHHHHLLPHGTDGWLVGSLVVVEFFYHTPRTPVGSRTPHTPHHTAWDVCHALPLPRARRAAISNAARHYARTLSLRTRCLPHRCAGAAAHAAHAPRICRIAACRARAHRCALCLYARAIAFAHWFSSFGWMVSFGCCHCSPCPLRTPFWFWWWLGWF